MPRSFSLSRDQRDAFEREGVLRLPDFYPPGEIARMADRVWDDLERRFGVRRDDPATWSVVRPAQFQGLARSGAFAAMGSPALLELADAFLGPGALAPPKWWGLPLVTFPAETWDMPRVMWHLDYPAEAGDAALHAIRAFVMLEAVAAHGGGTLYVAGSHRVAQDIAARDGRAVPSAKMRGRLTAAHPWFARLWGTRGDTVRALLGRAAQVAGVAVSVEEMTGEAGDLIVMHPAMLHGLSHNALDRPRMMLVQSLSRRP